MYLFLLFIAIITHLFLCICTLHFQTTSNTWYFNVKTEEWTQAADMRRARYLHACSMLGNSSVIVTGGWDGNYVDEIEKWDEQGGWSIITSAKIAIYGHTVIAQEDNILIIGGEYQGQDPSNKIQVLNLKKNRMEQNATLKEPRYFHVAIMVPYGYLTNCEGKYNGLLQA